MTETTSVKIEEINPVKKKLSFEIPWDDVRKELDSAYEKIGKKARIKGFRPGKTPRRLLENYYKEEAESEAVSSIISKAYWEAVEQNKLMPATQPEIDQKGIEKEKDFQFTVTVEVSPDVDPKDYHGIEFEQEGTDVTDADIDKRIEELRQVYSTLEDLTEDRGIENGDYVTIDFEGKIGGEPVKDLKGEGVLLEIGSNRFLPGFEEKLIGQKNGQTAEFKLALPESFQLKDAAGKEVDFTAAVKGIKFKKVPELNEEFIKNFDKYQSLDQLRSDVHVSLEEEAKTKAKADLRKNITDRLLESNQFEVPDAIVERQINIMLLNMQRRMVANGMDPKQSAEMVSGWRESARPEAVRQVKLSFLLEAIAKKESLAVGDEEMEESLKNIASRYGQDYEKVKKSYQESNMLEELRAELLEQKTLDFLEDRAKITQVKKSDKGS
ncbi:MAG: trigger factor [Syntrophaceae bacterium]